MKCICGSERIITLGCKAYDVNIKDVPFASETGGPVVGEEDVWVCNSVIDEIGLYYETFDPIICLDCRRIINGMEDSKELGPIPVIEFTVAENHEETIEL